MNLSVPISSFFMFYNIFCIDKIEKRTFFVLKICYFIIKKVSLRWNFD